MKWSAPAVEDVEGLGFQGGAQRVVRATSRQSGIVGDIANGKSLNPNPQRSTQDHEAQT